MAENDEFIVPGFQASGIAAGIKEDGKKDLALLYSEVPTRAAGVFTTNVFKAAPVLLDMERIKQGHSRAIIINSGNANAATGRRRVSGCRQDGAVLCRCPPGRRIPGARGLDGRHRPEAAHRQGCRQREPSRQRSFPRRNSRGGPGHHDDGPIPQNAVPRGACRRQRDLRLRDRQGCGDDRTQHGDDAVLHPDRCRHRRSGDEEGSAGGSGSKFECHQCRRLHEYKRLGDHPGKRPGRQSQNPHVNAGFFRFYGNAHRCDDGACQV